jgi:hypothetical protein
VLPPDREAWAKEQAEALIAGLAGSGYQVLGDLDELRPRPSSGPGVAAGDQPPDQVLDAAVDAAAALVVNQYRKQQAGRPGPARWSGQDGRAGRGGLAGRVEAAAGASPRLKRTVRELSSRYPAVRKLRVLAWQALERTRAQRNRTPGRS